MALSNVAQTFQVRSRCRMQGVVQRGRNSVDVQKGGGRKAMSSWKESMLQTVLVQSRFHVLD